MTSQLADGPGQAELRSGRWTQARDVFRGRLEQHPDGYAFEGLAQAFWWLDDGSACLEARESAYRFFRDAGDDTAAARAATALAYDSLLFGEGVPVAYGWWQRAADLLERVPECEEHGWLAVREAELALATHRDPTGTRDAGERAAAIGRRLGDGDLVHVGLALSGLARTAAGDPASGVPRLDAAVAAATAGDVSDLMWMGKIFCWLISACQETHDLSRADEWCRRVEVVCRRQNLDPLFTVCRIQHSSVLIARGTWQQAEQNLTVIIDGVSASRRHTRLDAVVQLGELRRRQGRWTEADELLGQAEFDTSAICSRALIRLARGEPRPAWEAIRGLLLSTPERHRMARARLLLPAVRAAHAAGDREAAESAAAELQAITGLVANPSLSGLAAAAAATLASDNEAVGLWRQSVQCFHEAHLPFDTAESRLGLAAVLVRTGDLAGAREQLTAATHLLESLGAGGVLEEAGRLGLTVQQTAADRDGPVLSDRETEVLRLVAEGRTNQQIADALILSPHTVHRHVAHILAKLDRPTRAGAAAYAISAGLLSRAPRT